MSVQGELALEGLPTRLLSCTPTRLTTWLDCPRRYRFTYLDRPQPPKGLPWAHNSLGSAVHLALAGWCVTARYDTTSIADSQSDSECGRS